MFLMNSREAGEWMRQRWRELVVPPSHKIEPYRPRCGGSTSAIYFLWGDYTEAYDELLYVGIAASLANRLLAHWRADAIPFSSFGCIVAPREVLAHAEAAYIEALMPPFNNKLEQPRWRGHAEMVDTIKSLWEPAKEVNS